MKSVACNRIYLSAHSSMLKQYLDSNLKSHKETKNASC